MDLFLSILFYTGIIFLLVIVGGLCLVFYLAHCYDKSEASKNIEKNKLENTRKKAMIETPHVVSVSPNNLYARTPEALQDLLKELKTKGYEVKDCREDEKRDASIEVQEKNGWYLWYARLKTVEQKGICKTCDARISTSGIWTHEHECENCGAFTYLEFTQGSKIRFHFKKEERETSPFEPSLQMTIYGYDKETGSILLYADPDEGNNFNDWKKENAEKILQANEHQIQRLTAEDGTSLISIKYSITAAYDEDEVINSVDIFPHHRNASIVKVYDGKEYSEYGSLPVPESYVIYESWHWAPLCGPSTQLHEKIMRAAGLVTRCDYYYQDGRPAFNGVHFQRMRTFVQHFTDIDLKAWDNLIRRAPKDGRGFIVYLASYCQNVSPDKAQFQEEPNIGNVLVGMSKRLSGDTLTFHEMAAMIFSLKDLEVHSQAETLWKALITAKDRTP